MSETLPPALARFLDTLGIADRPENGDYRFKTTEPDF